MKEPAEQCLRCGKPTRETESRLYVCQACGFVWYKQGNQHPMSYTGTVPEEYYKGWQAVPEGTLVVFDNGEPAK
jgi:hypothetical protein